MKKRAEKATALDGFLGLDLTRKAEAVDPRAARLAENVDLTLGGGYRARAQLKPMFTVDSSRLGLYVAAGRLRTCIPYRSATPVPVAPAGIIYDIVGDGTTAYTLSNPKLAAAVSWDDRPYIALESDVTAGVPARGRKVTHHYLPQQAALSLRGTLAGAVFTFTDTQATAPAAGSTVWLVGSYTPHLIQSSSTASMTLTPTPSISGTALATVFVPTDTRVTLPFEPGPALFSATEKIWAPNKSNGDVHFSSTLNGPTDWTETADAGFLPTSRHVGGNAVVRGFGAFNNQMVVFYDNTAQLWTIDADPAQHRLYGVVGGAGTEQPGSIANVMGDVVYFAQGGFRSLSAVITTGQAKDGDVGARIMALTREIDFVQQPAPVSLWSPSRAQYLCAVGSTAYVLTNSVQQEIRGWTTYRFNNTVEALAELDGVTYVLLTGDNTVYAFDESYTGETGFSWAVRWAYFYAEDHRIRKLFRFLDPIGEGTATMSFLYEPQDESLLHTLVAPVNMDSTERVYLGVLAKHMALQASGTGVAQIDQFVYTYDVGTL